MRRVWIGVALVAGLALGACGGQGDESAPEAPAGTGAPEAEGPEAQAPSGAEAPAGPTREELRATGRELFLERCATCHGENGDGQGPGAAGLSPKPRDFRDAAWQESVTDQHIEQVVAYGGAAVGLSPIMPAHPDLANDPQKLAALRTFIRSLGQ